MVQIKLCVASPLKEGDAARHGMKYAGAGTASDQTPGCEMDDQ